MIQSNPIRIQNHCSFLKNRAAIGADFVAAFGSGAAAAITPNSVGGSPWGGDGDEIETLRPPSPFAFIKSEQISVPTINPLGGAPVFPLGYSHRQILDWLDENIGIENITPGAIPGPPYNHPATRALRFAADGLGITQPPPRTSRPVAGETLFILQCGTVTTWELAPPLINPGPVRSPFSREEQQQILRNLNESAVRNWTKMVADVRSFLDSQPAQLSTAMGTETIGIQAKVQPQS